MVLGIWHVAPSAFARLSNGDEVRHNDMGQLDGDDPRGDALPNLAVGRLPVKTEAELVQKLIRYDTAPAGGSPRGKAVYVADNPDGAGDFASVAELSVVEQPVGIAVERVSFQPSLQARPVSGIADARQARARTLAALNQGAGLVNDVGHSHTWQWTLTDPAVTPSYLLGLYDVDALVNGDRLPIVLEMTCLTSAFQQPAAAERAAHPGCIPANTEATHVGHSRCWKNADFWAA